MEVKPSIGVQLGPLKNWYNMTWLCAIHSQLGQVVRSAETGATKLVHLGTN